MEKITPDKIRQGLRTYIRPLHGHQLYALVNAVKLANTWGQLPVPLKESLELRKYLPPRNLLETIREELLELIPWRCLNGNLISLEHSRWLMTKTQQQYSRSSTPTRDYSVPGIIREYFNYFSHRECFQEEVKLGLGSSAAFPVISLKRYEKCDPASSDQFYVQVESTLNIVLSEVKEEVQNWLLRFHCTTRDVHFVAKNLFSVNCSLDTDIWRGVDILVVAKNVKCVPLQTADSGNDYEEKAYLWDISGADGAPFEIEKSSQGKQGRIGRNGDHGGHLLFIARHYENMKDLVVLSNGGNGGRGQHGGDGLDGEDGKNGDEWTVNEMLTNFPPSATNDALRNLLVENTLRIGGLELFRYDPLNALDKYSGKVLGTVTDFYAKGTISTTGVAFEVGFEKGVFQKTAFCLVSGCEGFPGQPGGLGGMGGLGGVGGQKGSVTLIMDSIKDQNDNDIGNDCSDTCVTAILKPGRNGRVGRDGQNGKPGRNGRNGKDVGYMAWSGKELSAFPPGKYKLKMKVSDDSRKKQDTMHFKLLNKYVTIAPKTFVRQSLDCSDRSILSEIMGAEEARESCSSISETSSHRTSEYSLNKQDWMINETLKRIEKYKLMQRHGRKVSMESNLALVEMGPTKEGNKISGNRRSEFHAEWWMRKILNMPV